MKCKFFLILLCTGLFAIQITAQTTRQTTEQVQEVMNKFHKQMDSILNDPTIRNRMQNAGAASSTQSKTSVTPSKILLKKFPSRKTALLASLPKRALTKQELVSFVTSLHTDLE